MGRIITIHSIYSSLKSFGSNKWYDSSFLLLESVNSTSTSHMSPKTRMIAAKKPNDNVDIMNPIPKYRSNTPPTSVMIILPPNINDVITVAIIIIVENTNNIVPINFFILITSFLPVKKC